MDYTSFPGEAVHPGEVVIHPGALFAVVDPGDLAGDAVEERIVQADLVADLEDRHLPHGAVLAQQMLGKVQIPREERPPFSGSPMRRRMPMIP